MITQLAYHAAQAHSDDLKRKAADARLAAGMRPPARARVLRPDDAGLRALVGLHAIKRQPHVKHGATGRRVKLDRPA